VKSDPENDDVHLFRQAVQDVKPIAPERPAAPRRAPAPRARFTRADRYAVLQESLAGGSDDPAAAAGDELVFHRAGLQSPVLRKLRRGQYRVEAELDLHGHSVVAAKHALREFLTDALHSHMRCVRIIHGKGLRSGHRGPVLKSAVSGVLRRTGAVVAYVSARPVDGGTGAVYVLLSS
jgi:DNA-nicking Smr family endonuclease